MSDLFHEALVYVWNLTKALEDCDKPEDRALVEEAKEFLRQNPYLNEAIMERAWRNRRSPSN